MCGYGAAVRQRRELRSTPALLAVGLVVVALVWLRWIDPSTWNLVDLGVYRAGGRAVLDGTDVYAAASPTHPELVFTYPPFAALLSAPLALAGETGAGWMMTVLSLASYAVVVVVAVKASAGERARSPRQLWAWSALLWLLGLALEPVQRTLIYGQVNLVLAALVLLDLYVVPRRFRGVLIGLAAGIKLTPAVFGVALLLRRDWASTVRSLLTAAGTVIVGWAALSEESRFYWAGGGVDLARFGEYAVRSANQSVRAVLVRAVGEPGWLYLLLAAAVVVLTGVAALRLCHAGDDLAMVTALAVGSLLVSPVSWAHHWVWVAPALVVMARRRWRGAVGATVLVMFLPPMWAANGDPLSLSAGEQVLAATYALLGTAYVVALAIAPTPARPLRGLMGPDANPNGAASEGEVEDLRAR